MPTEERIDKITKVLSLRQPDLRVVLEEITISHNISAVIRTCDATGVLNLDIISSSQEPLPINKAISTRAEKWIQFHNYSSTSKCLNQLKKKGIKIAATYLQEKGCLLYTELDYTQPIAIIFGNESEGVSRKALKLADYRIRIPIIGMVQSLNLSVSVAIILYEAFKQRMTKGYFEKRRLSPEEFDLLFKKWLYLAS